MSQPLTIGEAARIAGVTVRTLHHYDDIGLLVPSERSAAGYRLYAAGDLERLQQILLYRELDLPLEAIRRLLLPGVLFPSALGARVVGFTVALALAAGALAGLAPGLQARRLDVTRDLAAGARTGAGRSPTRALLTVGQTALSVLLLVGVRTVVGMAPERAPQLVARGVARDREEPGRELRLRRITIARAMHAQERLLYQLFGHGPVLHHPHQEA